MILSLAVSYFLIAPQSAGGLHLGAMGLALQMLVVQVVAVNVQLYFNAKHLGLRMSRYVAHQIASAAALLVLAHAARRLADGLIGPGFFGVGAFVAAGIAYTAAVAAVGWTWPKLFGLDRDQLSGLLAVLRAKLSPGVS